MWKDFITDMEAFVDLLGCAGHHRSVDLDDKSHGTCKDACPVFLRDGPVEGVARIIWYEIDGLVGSSRCKLVSVLQIISSRLLLFVEL